MSKNEQTIVAVLTEIIRLYGIDIFKEQKRVYSLLSDMAPGDHRIKERRRFKAALESGAIDILLKAVADKASCELYINESIACLISHTDMAEDIAKETVLNIAKALSLTIPQKSKENKIDSALSKKKNTVTNNSNKRKQKKSVNLKNLYITICVLAIIALVIGFFFTEPNIKHWLIGFSSSIILTVITIGIAYAFQEHILFNEMCQTISIAIPIWFVTNIVLRIVLGNEEYELIFRIISLFMAVGSIANAIYTRINWEEKWTWPNIVMAVCNVFLLFFWPGNFSWITWQWIIGIGGGLLLAAIVFAVVEILDAIGPEVFISLSVILLILTFTNFNLLYTFGESYMIIAECYAVILAIGSIVGAVMCYKEAATKLQILNIILFLINIL